jgi:chromosome condensin MukBEF MukE localization factor
VNPTDITRFDKRRDSMMLPKKYWTQHDDFYTSYANCQSVRPPDVYFRLRNKVTNKVSRLSRAKLTIEANKSVAPAKWKVV